jgi:hypothetical protein
MHRIDGPGATADNKFTAGNPTTGAPATEVTAEWANAVQEEPIAVILAAGLELNKADNGQLLQAIQLLIAGGGETVTAAGVAITDAGGYIDGTDVEAALQQLAAKLYAGTLSANQVRRSVVASAGTSVSTAAGHAENIVELSNAGAITYTVNPDSSYNAPIGTEIVLVQAGAGQVTIVAGAGVTLRKPASFNAKTLEQHASVVLYKTAANTWRLGGILEAAA